MRAGQAHQAARIKNELKSRRMAGKHVRRNQHAKQLGHFGFLPTDAAETQ